MPDIEMVINLHVTERCQFRCTYCFGQWGLLEESSRETSVFADTETALVIMKDLVAKFRSDRDDSRVRFNFVGGEPALLPNIDELVVGARDLGARTSYVSNGLMLRRFSPEWTAANIDVVGLSVDSPSPRTNLAIGRITRSGAGFDLDFAATWIRALRDWAGDAGRPAPEVKVNTVVSELNATETFGPVLTLIKPDRWKILKMLPVYTTENSVSDEAFRTFARRHKKYVRKSQSAKGIVITTEDNDEMTGSYAMIDPLARFFWYDDSPSGGYGYSDPITVVGVDEAWKNVRWDEHKFESRYTELLPDPLPAEQMTPQLTVAPASDRLRASDLAGIR